jgi:hypothetical protein
MNAIRIAGTAALLGLAPVFPAAAGFDGSQPILCAPASTVECIPTEPCLEGTAESIDMPAFLWIDLQQQRVWAKRPDGSVLDTAIQIQARDGGALILQGIEDGRGWTAAIGEETGKLTVTAAGRDVGFIVFGACTTLDAAAGPKPGD